MKTLLMAVLVAAVAIEACGQSLLTKRDNTVGTNAVVIFPGQSGQHAVLRHVDVTGDHADATLQILAGSRRTLLESACALDESNLSVASTNGFGVGDGLVILQRPDGVCSAHFYAFVDGGVVEITPVAGVAAPAGTQVWWAGHVATNAIGSATVRLDGTLWAGQAAAPLALRLHTVAGTAVRINAAAAGYQP